MVYQLEFNPEVYKINSGKNFACSFFTDHSAHTSLYVVSPQWSLFGRSFYRKKVGRKKEGWWWWQEIKWHWISEDVVWLRGYHNGKCLVTEDSAKHPLLPVFQFV